MKNANINSNAINKLGNNETFKHGINETIDLNFKDYLPPPPMPDQQIAPPPYVWDRIVSILDQQDREKQISTPQQILNSRKKRRFKVSALVVTSVVCIYYIFN